MPLHRPTKEQRQNVTILCGLGATPEMIAGTLGIETDTVTRAYATELAAGPDQVKLEAMAALFKAAKGNGAGKVMAATRLLDLLTQGDKPDATGAVKPSGKLRIVVEGQERCALYDDNGDLAVFISEDEKAV